MIGRYLYTVFTGRAGGEQTTEIFEKSVSDCIARNEFPGYMPTLPGAFGTMQRQFHRKFIETDELLGRGNVIDAFVRGDSRYIEKVARLRFEMIWAEMRKMEAQIFIDVSKNISRGMHTVIDQIIPEYSVLLIVRDPIANMRSFLNRRKKFLLDNNMPDHSCNEFVIDSAGFEKGEFYLWMWCEIQLRYQKIISSTCVDKTAILRTEDINDSEKIKEVFEELQLSFQDITINPPKNTNIKAGYGPTKVCDSDIRLFEKFLKRIPHEIKQQIPYLNDYDPGQSRIT